MILSYSAADRASGEARLHGVGLLPPVTSLFLKHACFNHAHHITLCKMTEALSVRMHYCRYQDHYPMPLDNISLDRHGRGIIAWEGLESLLVTADGSLRRIDFSSVFEVRTLYKAISPDGDESFVRTRTGIWRAPLGPDGQLAGKATLLVAPGNDDVPPITPFNQMLSTGPHLYFWQDTITLMRVHLATGALEFAAEVPDEGGYSSWALHVPATAAGTGAGAVLYLKRNYVTPEVQVIQLGSGSLSTLTIPDHRNDEYYLQACTGDGQIVMARCNGRRPASNAIDLWDPARPEQPPEVLVGDDAFFDAASDPGTTFYRIEAAAIAPTGQLWVTSSEEQRAVRGPHGLHNRYGGRVCCVGTPLVPPAYLTAPPPTSTDTSSWEVVGSAADMMAAQGTMLQDPDGTVVHIQVADGEVLRAHGCVLAVHSEWFRALLERWQQEGGSASASSSSGRVCKVYAQEMPTAVVQAMLQFLYTGRVVLGGGGVGEVKPAAQAAGGSKGRPAAKKARKASGDAASTAAEAGASSGASQWQQSGAAQQPHMLFAQLLHAAQFYGVPSLRAACLEIARVRIGLHIALPWLAFAHQQGEVELKALALGWAAQHYKEIRDKAPETLTALHDQPPQLTIELMDAVLAAKE